MKKRRKKKENEKEEKETEKDDNFVIFLHSCATALHSFVVVFILFCYTLELAYKKFALHG